MSNMKETSGEIKEAPKVKEAARKPRGSGYCCYIGPSIRGVIQQNSLFEGTVDEARAGYSELIGRNPDIARLFVDGADLAEARRNAGTPGNLLYILYHKVLGK